MLKCIVYSQQKGDDRSKRMEISFLKGQEKHSKTKKEKEQYTQKNNLRKDFFMKTKKLLSVVLIALMLLSCIPILASAATVKLSASNVIILEAPKISYGDQIEVSKVTVNYGVRTNELTVTGGKLGYIASEGADPVEVPGTFSATSTIKLSVSDNASIRLKFTPDDTETYSSPTVAPTWTMAEGVVWPSAKVIGLSTVLAEAPTAPAIYKGDRITAAKLTGGRVNDADGNEISGNWTYVDTSLYPEVSGNYDIQWKKTGYETIKTTVYITVYTDYVNTEIAELPTIAESITYGTDLSTVPLTGGKAVVTGTDTVVAGKFTLQNGTLPIGSWQGNVTFTPDDPSAYRASSAYMPIKVEKAPVKFIDENGNEIVPEIKLGYNNKQLQHNLDEIKNLLAPYANCDQFWANFYANSMDMPHAKDALEVGTTKEYEIHSHSYNDNYTSSILKFKLTVVPRECSMTLRYADNIIKVDTNKPLTDSIYGTFEYYANGELIGTSAITETTDTTGIRWKPDKSGTYDITVKYVVAENDKYYFPEVTIEDMEILCSWGVTVNGGSVKVSNSYEDYGTFTYGDSVSILGAGAMFSHWVITDKDGNEIDLDGVDKTVSGNTFIMPDFNVTFTAVELTQRKVNLENAIILNAVGTADAPVRYRGENVRIKLDTDALSEDLFNKWVITDADGKDFLPEGLTESDLTSTQISFIMPDHDITVRAATAADDCDHLCHSENPIMQLLWKVLHFMFRLFNVQQYCDCGMKHYESPLFSF